MRKLLVKYEKILVPLFIVAFVVKYLLDISDPYGIVTLLFGAFIFAIQPQCMKNFVLLDWAVTFFSVVNFAACFSNGITAACVSEGAFFAVCLGAYSMLRQREVGYADRFLTVFFAVAAVALLLAVISFFVFRHNTLKAGFADCYDFRYLYHPMGFTCNMWAESALAVLALLLWHRKFQPLFLFLAILAVLLTFSRGAYIALAFLSVVFLTTTQTRKNFLIAFLAAMMITLVFCHRELFKTLSFNTQTIQKQSTEWRINSAHDDIEVIKEKPVFGHGIDSYCMVTGKSHDLDSRKNFSSVAPNFVIKTAVEQGVLGIAVLLLLQIAVVLVAIKHWDKQNIKISIAVLAVIMIKEMSQSSFPENHFTFFLCYILFGVIHKSCYQLEVSIYDIPFMRYCTYAMYVAVILNVAINKFNISLINSNEFQPMHSLVDADICLLKKNAAEAEKILKPLCEKYPCNSEINYYLGRSYQDSGDTANAIAHLSKSVLLAPKILLSNEFKALADKDSGFFLLLKNSLLETETSNLSPQDEARVGFVLNHFGHKEMAETLLKSAVEKMPSLSTPWLLLGDTAKYVYLSGGAYQGENHRVGITDDKFTVISMFKSTYR